MNNEIINCNSMVQHAFNLFNVQGNELPSIWVKVVSKVGQNREGSDIGKTSSEIDKISLGEKLAANSHVVDFKNGVLLVEANHSGWIQYLKFNQKFILNGLNRFVPELKIRNLAFRVAGTNVSLSDRYEANLKADQEKMQQKIEKTEKMLENLHLQKKENTEKKQGSGLPPELLQKFESIKNTVLTNTQK